MGLGDVALVFGLLIAHGIALPGLALTWGLLCPALVARSRARLDRTPGRTFALGLGALASGGLLVRLGFAGGPVPGWFALGLLLALASVGAAGLAALLGERLRAEGGAYTPSGALLRGAVALELAVIVPIIGWFVILPLGTVAMLGAATWALLHRTPRAVAPTPPAWPTPPPFPGNVERPTSLLPVQLPHDAPTWNHTGVGHARHPS